MIPFARMIKYGNIAPYFEYDVAYNFSQSISYGRNPVISTVSSGTSSVVPVPVTGTGYTDMLRLTNSTINMSPDGVLDIGMRDFEYTIVFYLYPGGSSYDYVMNFSSNGTEDSVMMMRIADSGLGNRLQFSIGAYDTGNRYSCNKTRTDLEGKVNEITIRRQQGVVTSYLNAEQMLMGSWVSPSTNLTMINSSNVQVNKYYFGEYDGSTKFGEDIGYIDFRFKYLEE